MKKRLRLKRLLIIRLKQRVWRRVLQKYLFVIRLRVFFVEPVQEHVLQVLSALIQASGRLTRELVFLVEHVFHPVLRVV
jgi:hypothetical protein